MSPHLAQLNLQNLRTQFKSLPSAVTGSTPQQRIGELIIAIIQILLSLSAVLAVAAMIWGAIMYITSIGNDQRTATAKKIIFWAIAGLLMIGVGFILILLIGSVFGFNP